MNKTVPLVAIAVTIGMLYRADDGISECNKKMGKGLGKGEARIRVIDI